MAEREDVDNEREGQIMSARPVPDSPEAEASLLSVAMLASREQVAEIAEVLRDDAFHVPTNARLFAILTRLAAEGKPYDADGITAALAAESSLESAGGPMRISELSRPDMDPNHWPFYADALNAIARDRAAISATERALVAMRSGDRDGARALLTGAMEDIPDGKKREGADLAKLFVESTMTAGAIYALHLPDSAAYLGPVIREGTLGTIFAPRGLGKTWLSTAIGAAIAEGRDLGEWKSDGAPHTVLIIDGEMSLRDTRDRIRLLGVKSDRLKFLHHEVVYELGEKGLNLAHRAQQEAVLKYCDAIKAEVVILDNLSSLFTGVAENDADAWEIVQPWLLDLRRRKIAVVVVGHAGRNGEWRGSSKREDVLNWIVKLKPKGAADDDRPGAEFVSVFTKNRGATDRECASLVWRFNAPEEEGGTVTIECQRHGGYDAFLECVREGIDQNSEIAEELGISKGQVSKFAKRAEKEGRLKIEGRRYVPA